jgi:hypothetical protein
MYIFWLTAAILAAVGGLLWYKLKTINAYEWAGGAAVAFIMAGIFQFMAVYGATSDVETWSGQLIEARFVPEWTEYYEVAVYRTEHRWTGSGKNRRRVSYQVFDHWSPRTRTHQRHWTKTDSFGRDWEIGKTEYDYILKDFGKMDARNGTRRTSAHDSRMLSGDALDYVAVNVNNVIYPTTQVQSWENVLKAAPSVFSYSTLTVEKENPNLTPLFDYPANGNPFTSDRLLGTAQSTITALEFDKFNSRVGPSKFINVILVGFGDTDSSVVKRQEAKWIGGKKNDFIVMYGGKDKFKPSWCQVVSWTESDLCKRNVETIVLENKVDNSILPLLEKEIRERYVLKDWHKFDYVVIEPPTWSIVWFFVVVVLVQGGLWTWFHLNEHGKQETRDYGFRRRFY